MTQAAPPPADGKELQGAVRREGSPGGGSRGSQARAGCVRVGLPRAPGVGRAAESPELTRPFLMGWFNIPFLGEAETVVSLVSAW